VQNSNEIIIDNIFGLYMLEILVVQGGSKGGPGVRCPIQKSGPLWPPKEVHHADILTEVYAIASLQLSGVSGCAPVF